MPKFLKSQNSIDSRQPEPFSHDLQEQESKTVGQRMLANNPDDTNGAQAHCRFHAHTMPRSWRAVKSAAHFENISLYFGAYPKWVMRP
jgi:hypothetical protein